MEWIWAAIIALAVSLAAAAYGGGVVGYNLKPATNVYVTYQYITMDSKSWTEVKTMTYTYQGQVTMVDTRTNFNLDVSLVTNLFNMTNHNSNYTVKTNYK